MMTDNLDGLAPKIEFELLWALEIFGSKNFRMPTASGECRVEKLKECNALFASSTNCSKSITSAVSKYSDLGLKKMILQSFDELRMTNFFLAHLNTFLKKKKNKPFKTLIDSKVSLYSHRTVLKDEEKCVTEEEKIELEVFRKLIGTITQDYDERLKILSLRVLRYVVLTKTTHGLIIKSGTYLKIFIKNPSAFHSKKSKYNPYRCDSTSFQTASF